MSYWLFKAKRNIQVGTKILPLALYADSSVRDVQDKHIYSWGLYNISDDPGLLVEKSVLEEARKTVLKKELASLNDFRKNFPDYPDKSPVSMDSYCYAGNSYPGGRKVKNMDSFNSVRRPCSVEDVMKENGSFGIGFWYYDKKTYRDVGEKSYFRIREEQDIIDADAAYRKFKDEMPEGCGAVVDITGLSERISNNRKNKRNYNLENRGEQNGGMCYSIDMTRRGSAYRRQVWVNVKPADNGDTRIIHGVEVMRGKMHTLFPGDERYLEWVYPGMMQALTQALKADMEKAPAS